MITKEARTKLIDKYSPLQVDIDKIIEPYNWVVNFEVRIDVRPLVKSKDEVIYPYFIEVGLHHLVDGIDYGTTKGYNVKNEDEDVIIDFNKIITEHFNIILTVPYIGNLLKQEARKEKKKRSGIKIYNVYMFSICT